MKTQRPKATGNRRLRRAAIPGLIALLLTTLACQRAGWNWDLEWWKRPDRRVGPTSQPADDESTTSAQASVWAPSAPQSPSPRRPAPRVIRPVDTQ
ncbi:MAG TPA: hypothetical protein P5081_04290 [Phycisphaerae bacterium]|nr:hypothetical protein [Phycisphaerae bacterium]HRW52080.1 hypothetical protein [Phycisphaerae bacterium]